MAALSLRFAERLIMGVGPKPTLIAGLAAGGAALLLFARAPVDGSWAIDILPVMLLSGAGAGLSFPALMTLAMSGATPGDSGLASGLINTTVQVGGAIGLAVLATLATERTGDLTAGGHATASELNSGYHLAFLLGAVLVAAAIVVAASVLRPHAEAEAPRRAEAERTRRDACPEAA
jgi:MFS family permease